MCYVSMVLVILGGTIGPGTGLALAKTPSVTQQAQAKKPDARQVLQAAKRHDWKAARALAGQVHDPLTVKLYEWLYYTQAKDPVDFARISSFMKNNPAWPRQIALQQAAEQAMPADLSDAEVISWFSHYAPQTPEGIVRYLKSLSRAERNSEARKVLRHWWRTASLSPDQQLWFLERYEKMLDREAMAGRLDTLLSREQYKSARFLAQVIGHGYSALVEARVALAENSKNARGKLAAVPAQLRGDPGLLFERLRWCRRNDRDFDAIEILHNAPPPEKIANPDAWWSERQMIARDLMDRGQYESAYLLVSKDTAGEGTAFAEARFLSGWLALRYLNEPAAALTHFEVLYNGTTMPVSRARGAYWAGRASEALNQRDSARQWYQLAANNQMTFYGQLAIGKLDIKYRPEQQGAPERSLTGMDAFNKKELVRAARLLAAVSLRAETTDILDALVKQAREPEDYFYAAELSYKLDHYHNAIRAAKQGLKNNVFLMDYTFPTMLARMRNVDIDWSLVHAVIRQESSFDHTAISPAGAQGLMQIMPATARHIAGKNGLPHYHPNILISDPEVNIRMGSSYLKQMINKFDGSYPLALAAYNAGPGRVGGWIKRFGDPRNGKVDVIDWIERIPYTETRNYVQRVMEGFYIYRLKLKDVQKSAQTPIHVALETEKSIH